MSFTGAYPRGHLFSDITPFPRIHEGWDAVLDDPQGTNDGGCCPWGKDSYLKPAEPYFVIYIYLFECAASLKDFFQNADAIRWPDFKFVGNSLHVGSRASMCNKVIGYTSFFLFYGVIPGQWKQFSIDVGYMRRSDGGLSIFIIDWRRASFPF